MKTGFSPRWRRLFSWLVLLHAAAFLFFWLTNRFFYAETNNYLLGMLGMDLDYISLCLGWAALLGGWSLVRVVYPGKEAGARPAWRRVGGLLYGLLGMIFLIFFYGSFSLLFQESPVQVTRLGRLLIYHRLLIDPVVWAGLVLVLRAAAARRPGGGRAGRLLLLAAVWALPLALPPGSVLRGSLPDKPLLIAHRGASMLAPENTIAAAVAAAAIPTYGIESDVRVSLDGQLFLMHDSTLARTTNVAEIFPDRAADRAESFTRAELDQLDAVSWFLTEDPFGTVQSGEADSEDLEAFARHLPPFPAFSDWLEIVRQSGQIFIFDLLPPPADHPYAGDLLVRTLAEIQAAGVEDQIWLLLEPTQSVEFANSHPGIGRAAGIDSHNPPAAGDLLTQQYQIVNAEYDLPPAAAAGYRAAGLWVNLYTVDEPWLYSHLWLTGVNSVTSNNVHTFAALGGPVLMLTWPAYLAGWAVVGLLGVLGYLWRRA